MPRRYWIAPHTHQHSQPVRWYQRLRGHFPPSDWWKTNMYVLWKEKKNAQGNESRLGDSSVDAIFNMHSVYAMPIKAERSIIWMKMTLSLMEWLIRWNQEQPQWRLVKIDEIIALYQIRPSIFVHILSTVIRCILILYSSVKGVGCSYEEFQHISQYKYFCKPPICWTSRFFMFNGQF